jgi:hypothetical protein
LLRLQDGDQVESDGDGRARLRLDDGTVCIIDRDSRLRISELAIEVQQGRAFVVGAVDGRARLKLAGATTRVGTARIGVERLTGPAKMYAASEELVLVC